MGSIIQRQRKDGTFTFQAMVKIPGAKAAVRSFEDRSLAQAFVEEVEKSRRAAEKARAARRIEFPTADERAKMNQDEWEQSWLKETLRAYARSERISDRFRTPMRTIIKFGGDVKLGEIDRTWVRRYLDFARKQRTRTRTPYKWATIVDHMKIISAAMNWWAEEKEASGSKLPFKFTMIPKDWEVKRERRLEDWEEKALLRRMMASRRPSRRFWIRLLRLALNTGARLQELAFAEWKEFDLDQRTWIIPAGHTKCGKSRLVPLNKAAMRALRALALIRSESSPKVFHGLKNSKSISNVFSKMTIHMGLKDLRFHDLRHEAISRMVLHERRLSVFEIMKIVGHTSMEMLDRYTNLRGGELTAKLSR